MHRPHVGVTGRPREREGFALAVAIAGIVIIGGLIAGVFFASTQEFRMGRNGLLQARALTAAEYGLNRVIGTGWQLAWNTSLSTGGTIVVPVATGDGTSVDTVRVTRLTQGSFLVVSEGQVGAATGATARRRIGAQVVLLAPTIKILGGLTTRGATKIGGSSFISGNDTTYPGWDCPPAGAGLPGIALGDSSQITTSGCGGLTCVSGTPKVSEDPVADDTSTYTTFGSVDWATLTSDADQTLASGAVKNGMGPSYNADGSCNTSDPNNWGDPYRTGTGNLSCENYYPVIHSTGDMQLTGGYGQGMLLVDGDLSVSGGFEFYGPVIVRGRLKTTGTGGHFNGGVMAANVELDQNTVLGNAVIHYSACAVSRAISTRAKPTLAKGRPWVELY